MMFGSMSKRRIVLTLAGGLALCAASARAENGVSYPGTINISGATLFKTYFTAPAGTNDFIDANNDGVFGFSFTPPYVQQLAGSDFTTAYWKVQFRAVGSGNGLKDMVNYYNRAPGMELGLPTDQSTINRAIWWTTAGQSPYNPANPGQCPLAPPSIDIAVMDVPTTWFITQGTSIDAAWNKKPLVSGYGMNAQKDWSGNQSNQLKNLSSSVGSPSYSLNVNTSSPDNKTVFDSPIAWVPIAFVANRGTGLSNVDMSTLQYIFATGRSKNGENFAGCTRDSGSGTRNAAMNSIGVDPSFGRGENLGAKNNAIVALSDQVARLGPLHQFANLDASGTMVKAVQYGRLAVGYQGLAGADLDATAGKYDILNVRKDIAGGTQFVRPSLYNILHNSDINSGWQVGGNETMATVGDPEATTWNVNGNPMMLNQAAAAYIRNTTHSISAFTTSAGADSNNNMPGEYMAYKFTLKGAIDALPSDSPLDPTVFVANTGLNTDLQSLTATNGTINVPATNMTPAGLVPVRLGLASGTYSDGSTGGSYTDAFGNAVTSGLKMSARNAMAGDFNDDGSRNINDIAKMMEAVKSPRTFEAGIDHGGDKGEMTHDAVIVEVIGDFNADGNFDSKDVRYFADGLAINPATGNLDRKEGFTRVDNAWLTLSGSNNYFSTTIAGVPGKTYQSGDSRGDVAGASTAVSRSITAIDQPGRVLTISGDYAAALNSGTCIKIVVAGDSNTPSNNGIYSVRSASLVGSNTSILVGEVIPSSTVAGTISFTTYARQPGANPTADGKVDWNDVLYIKANYGSWANLADAARMDLSCDMNGDMVVDDKDVAVVIHDILGLTADINLDGTVDALDLLAMANAWGTQTGDANFNAMADLNHDGQIDIIDVLTLADQWTMSVSH
jgi:hypothetical protein